MPRFFNAGIVVFAMHRKHELMSDIFGKIDDFFRFYLDNTNSVC